MRCSTIFLLFIKSSCVGPSREIGSRNGFPYVFLREFEGCPYFSIKYSFVQIRLVEFEGISLVYNIPPIIMTSQEKQEALEKKLLDLAEKEKALGPHKFWDTQPVLKLDVNTDRLAPIETKTLEQIRKEPLDLPSTYEWYEMDVKNENEMKELFNLLEANYVEDDDAMFRFAYPIDFLRWALTPPKWKREWHLIVRAKESKKFVAFISAIPAKMNISEFSAPMVEINFLCVHKKLRAKRLAPLLISEITRRVNMTDTWQAIYTAGVLIPKPFCVTRYWHRSLNYPKLIDIGFTRIPQKYSKLKDPLGMLEKIYKVPDVPQIKGFRVLHKKDLVQVGELLATQLKKFNVAPHFTQQEVEHWLKPLSGVVNTYVVEDPETKKITDFASFYTIPSSVIGHRTHKILKAAYLFYHATTKNSLTELIRDCIIVAKKENFDVFNCLDLMENKTFVEELKFGIGDGNLYYYLYNYKMPEITPDKLGLVML
jgi:glycylpeptide N-tetradecanoyltransferase